jgi:hypothetical protein
MQEQYLGHIEPGMDVCDIAGEKIGTIAHVHRHAMEPVSTGVGADGGVLTAPREEFLEVKTGPLGLGKHLYVPFSAIDDVTSGCAFVKQSKDQAEQLGWDRPPDYLR